MSTEISLPWPPPELSPNARVHWAKKSDKFKRLKQSCWVRTKETGIKIKHDGHVALHITFCPPDRRRRDIDNMLASAKASLDGVALALGVDDSRFRLTLEVGEPVKRGAIVLRIE